MKKFLLTRLGRDFFIHKPITKNLSFQNNWDGSHILYRKKTIRENLQFIQEKYFEFSWNLANIYFINVRRKNILRILSSLIENREKAKNHTFNVELFYLNSTLNFGIPQVLVFKFEVYYNV